MIRPVLILTLLAAYIVAMVRLAGVSGVGGLDALAPQSRSVERAIEERRFADALPVALELQQAHDDEPLVAYWLATIFHGLNRPRDEVAAWETYVRLSSTPADACPAIADAYESLGDRAGSLAQHQRCVGYEPREPDHLVDLGEAWERDQQIEQALATYRSAVLLDPLNASLVRRIDEISRRLEAGQ
jgi:tetratricopeptide (TPR) repeat protein